jgi:hypothetical protein
MAKRQAAREVIAGRLSLVQAAALFGALNSLPPEGPKLSAIDPHVRPPRVPPRTDEERLCWHVIGYVKAELDGEPDRARAVVARLEAQLEEQRCQQGGLRLPDPPSRVRFQKLLQRARMEVDRLSPGGAQRSR